ncbi:ABC transporter substrate binding protein [Wolbachia endosymbiont (group A) of Aleiodes leptofemur]|uniref:ABC transporter substrate binding protein n=1 Tax=Wolbachia endosymbiont (group A) of Aleiodes leptofemur TaxID=3077919 RepID=UPI003341F136
MLFSVIFKAFYYKKYLLAFLSVLFFTVAVYANHKNIGIIVPLEHEAMTQIVNGIKESLQDQSVKITVKNAHGDPNALLTIIKQMQHQDILMPIGSSTSLMTISVWSQSVMVWI